MHKVSAKVLTHCNPGRTVCEVHPWTADQDGQIILSSYLNSSSSL